MPQSFDHRMAMAALEKKRRGEKPNREEAAALRHYERELEEQQRQKYFSAITKKDWCQWSGRQVKVINEQAERYGAPLLGATINLPLFVEWFYDFLAKNARKLSAADNEDPTLAGMASPALEKKRQLEAARLELILQREQGKWLERQTVHDAHSRIGAILRLAGESLRKQFGPAAQKILNDALDNSTHEVDRMFATDGDLIDLDQCGAG